MSTAITGYYATYDNGTPLKPLTGLGYFTGTLHTKDSVIVPDSGLISVGINPFSAFLMSMYNAGLHIAGGGNVFFDLSQQMDEAGQLSDFESVQILDFMSLLGAVLYDATIHIQTPTNPTPPARPPVATILAQSPGDPALMLEVMKHLGLSGILKFLYGERGISFEQFCECWTFFYPTQELQEQHYETTINYLRTKGIMLTGAQSEALISKAHAT